MPSSIEPGLGHFTLYEPQGHRNSRMEQAVLPGISSTEGEVKDDDYVSKKPIDHRTRVT